MRKKMTTRIVFTCQLLFIAVVILLYIFFFRTDRYRQTKAISTEWTIPRSSPNTTTPHFSEKRVMPSLLCLITASPGREKRMQAVNSTWLRRCSKTLFVYAKKGIPRAYSIKDKLFVDTNESKAYLTAKVKQAYQFVFKEYNDQFDWILKADDDTYIIVENLKLLLSNLDPIEPTLVGCHFKKHGKHGYMSGGAGYVISYSALRNLVLYGLEHKNCTSETGDEDVEIAKCLETVNTKIWSSLDVEGKQTFHAEPLGEFLNAPHPKWLHEWQWNTPNFGPDCCSKHPISFHHLKPGEILMYEQLLYKTKIGEKHSSKKVFQTETLEMKSAKRTNK